MSISLNSLICSLDCQHELENLRYNLTKANSFIAELETKLNDLQMKYDTDCCKYEEKIQMLTERHERWTMFFVNVVTTAITFWWHFYFVHNITELNRINWCNRYLNCLLVTIVTIVKERIKHYTFSSFITRLLVLFGTLSICC